MIARSIICAFVLFVATAVVAEEAELPSLETAQEQLTSAVPAAESLPVASSVPEVSPDEVEAGAALEIEPCTGGEWITASVRVNSSFLGETNDLGPLVLRRSAEGTVRLRSGDTVIIGGLRLIDRTQDRRKTRVVPTGRHDVEEEQEVWVLVEARASLAPLKYQDNAREIVP